MPYENGLPGRISPTLGAISVRGKHIETPERHIKLADETLYGIKAAGRNCLISVVKLDETTGKHELVAASWKSRCPLEIYASLSSETHVCFCIFSDQGYVTGCSIMMHS